MHPSLHAISHPDKPALIMAETGEVITFRALEANSNQIAQLFRSLGLNTGDTVALLLDNCPRFLDITWAAQRSGLHCVCIGTKLTVSEVEYIVKDSGAKLLIASTRVGATPALLAPLLTGILLYSVGDSIDHFRALDQAVAAMPATPIADQAAGTDMLYSSGTTGKPKGIRAPLPANTDIAAPTLYAGLVQALWGFGESSIYLSPAPLYHAAPLRSVMTIQKLGGTVVMMHAFDPEAALRAIEHYGITHSQWVPTHFVRLLKLPEAVKSQYNLSSLKVAVHAAAPCPVPVKAAMIDWFGPILVEYYAGTESNGMTSITAADWLLHKGSVGKAIFGTLHICNEDGTDLPPRSEGLIFFEGGPPFAYHNDPAKTAAATHPNGWTTLGDIGWLDEDGYLYLTDRQSFMIISGGVNIYPQDIENHLITHPKVMDVAVIGAPDAEFGEKVVAVVQPVDWRDAGDALAAELNSFARTALSSIKIPKQIDFVAELPREANGKLYKRLLRDRYWAKPVQPHEP